MKKCLTFVLMLLVMGSLLHAQDSVVLKYWVTLSDKDNSAYDIAHPELFLSQRALERRQRQHIAIDSLDLPVSEAYIQTLIDSGYVVQNRSKWLNGVAVFTLESAAGSRLSELPFVVEARLCDVAAPIRPLEETPCHEEPFIPTLFDRTNPAAYYGGAYVQIDQLNGVRLHEEGYEGQGMIIGVCDDGFPSVDVLTAFDTLREEGRLQATRDFVWGGDDVFNIHQHGTLVLSTMAAYQPGRYVGTAPKASYVLCRTENVYSETPMEEYNWVAAAEYLDSLGADVVTTSLGYYYYDPLYTSYTLEDLDGRSAPMSRGAAIAASRGMLLLNAAGNDGYANPQHLNVPADVEEVLTIGAVTAEGDRAGFSSYGPTADGRIKPDVMSLGQDVECFMASGEVSQVSGTSLATPIMAGMVTCLWQRYPDLTPAQLRDSVRAWGSLADAVDTMSGYGIPDFGKAFRDGETEGIIDISAPMAMLYPNPVKRGGEVHLPAGRVTVVDVRGREVKVESVGKGVIRMPQSASGIYFVRTISERGEVAILKLVVR